MARKARASAAAATATAAVVSSIATSGTRSKRKASASVATPPTPSMGAAASSSSPTTTVNVSVAATPTASGSSSAISPALKKRRTARAKVNAIPFPALYGSQEVINVDDEDEDDVVTSGEYRIIDVAAPAPVAAASRPQLNYANAPPGPTVKPDFHVSVEFATQARVLHQHGEYLDAMLTRACLYQNQNEFALLQVLEKPLQGFYVWTRTGVVGTAGDTVMEGPWPEANEAITRFRSLFLNKTLRHWDERHTQQHVNGGFTWIETHQIIVGEEDQTAAEAEAVAAAAATPQRKRRSTKKSRTRVPRKVKPQPLTEVRVARAALPPQATPPPSSLDEDVQSFLTMAIDAASVYSSADQRYYSYTTAKQPTKKAKSTAATVLVPTPLGKLTKAAIEKGFEALHRLDDALKCDADRTALTMLSNHFFSLVPHPQLAVIDSMVRLMEKVEMLVALCVHSGHHELLLPDLTRRYFTTNHLDASYDALKCRLMPLLPTSKEFGLVQAYIFNSYCCVGNTMGNNFGADDKLLTVFRVEKETEAARFAAYRTAPNRRVLWHGSRMSNWMGILKHGLLITPPGVPLNGSSLGAGLYFTDKISKAMAYSHASHDRQVFLLSEVALGSCKPSTTTVRTTASATNVHHSCHGVGRCVPDSNGDFVDALGAVWPLGKAKQTKDARATHGHNEFVVFNTAQARMRYVVVTRPLY